LYSDIQGAQNYTISQSAQELDISRPSSIHGYHHQAGLKQYGKSRLLDDDAQKQSKRIDITSADVERSSGVVHPFYATAVPAYPDLAYDGPLNKPDAGCVLKLFMGLGASWWRLVADGLKRSCRCQNLFQALLFSHDAIYVHTKIFSTGARCGIFAPDFAMNTPFMGLRYSRAETSDFQNNASFFPFNLI
jgi:hypothetical protein